MADNIRVNNNALSWGSIIVKIADERFHGFGSISFGDKRERVKGYGMGRHHAPRSRSRGKYTIEPVKLAGPTSTVHAMRETLAALAPDQRSYGDVEFQIMVQYFESDEIPLTVEIDGCVWVSNTTSHDESAENLKEELECDAMLIRRNGLTLFDSRPF
jgi:hypothetical protein